MATSLTPALKKMLSAAGCYFERQRKGDHEIWGSSLLGMVRYGGINRLNTYLARDLID